MKTNAFKIVLLVSFSAALLLISPSAHRNVSSDGTAWISDVYVNSSNNLRAVIDGVHQRYRLHVCRPGACFGDAPHYQYYQIYAGGTWPKDLWVVTNVNPDTVYCVEIKSDDGTVRHDVVAYRTGSGSTPYYGSIISRVNCPWMDGNLPPNVPNLVSPPNGSSTTDPGVSLCLQDTGDPDNYPRTYRDFYYRVEKTDGTWAQESGWTTNTCWGTTVPSAGAYRWRAQSGDGELGSGYTGWWEFSYNVPPPPGTTLDVRYVDQVYVQQTCEWINGKCYWNHCGPSSVAMLLHYEGKETRDVLYDRQATLDLVCAVKPGCRGGSNYSMILNTLHNKSLPSYVDWTPTFAEMQQSVDRGHPVLLSLRVPSHLTIVVGHGDNQTIVMNDPYGSNSWWNCPWPNCRNQPYIGTPQLKGDGIEYNYGDLNTLYAIFVAGSVAAPAAATATVGQAGGTLVNEGVTIDFPSQSALAVQSLAQSVTVTHTPQLSPTHSIDGFEASINSFRLNASGTDGQPLQEFWVPFTLTVEINPLLIENWDLTSGWTESEGSDLSGDEGQTQVRFMLAIWDSELQEWVIVPSTLDATNDQLTAQYDRFAEFSVLVQRQYDIFLPLTVRSG